MHPQRGEMNLPSFDTHPNLRLKPYTLCPSCYFFGSIDIKSAVAIFLLLLLFFLLLFLLFLVSPGNATMLLDFERDLVLEPEPGVLLLFPDVDFFELTPCFSNPGGQEPESSESLSESSAAACFAAVFHATF